MNLYITRSTNCLLVTFVGYLVHVLAGITSMDGSNIHKSAFFLVLLVLCPMTESLWKAVDPVCAAQITLVNHACSFLPFVVNPPPSHHSLVSAPSRNHTDGRHRHGHGSPPHSSRGNHHRHHRHHHNPEEELCCRWMREVDDDCVCELLAQLPAFLSRPVHQYSVRVGDGCHESFLCGSRIKIED